MEIVLFVTASLLLLFVIGVYIIYRICFGQYREKYPEDSVEQHMPTGPAYEPFKEVIEKGIRNVIDATDFEMVEIISADGLKLRGRYYHRNDGAPLVIFFTICAVML